MTSPASILIVDDEKPTRDGLRMALEERFECFVASHPQQALEILKTQQINILLTDLRMGTESGMDLLDEAQKLPQPPVSIMMTAYGSVDTAVEAMRRGAWHFVTKPLNLEEVEMLVLRASRSQSLEKENQSLKQENQSLRQENKTREPALERLIGQSPEMTDLRNKIKQMAPSRATVLIQGESGTGKELVAQCLHALSHRKSEKLVTVNCAALSSQLLESELFGHEKGAFTGATQRRIGRFEQAHGGTLFLDEIGEIDASTQVKLLRVLSERQIERVGSNTPIEVDVRVIAATHRPLETMIKEGDFREDLYFRLNVLMLRTPALRERMIDLASLSKRFLDEFAKENNKSTPPIGPLAFKALRSYSWPGNIRELRAALEHAVIMSLGDRISEKDLPESLLRTSSPQLPIPSENSPHGENTLDSTPEFNLHVIETRLIEQALAHTKGNRTLAAELLGISRRTLQRKLKDLPSSSTP